MTDKKGKRNLRTLVGIAALFIGMGSCDYLWDRSQVETERSRQKTIRAIVEQYGDRMSPKELRQYVVALGLVIDDLSSGTKQLTPISGGNNNSSYTEQLEPQTMEGEQDGR